MNETEGSSDRTFVAVIQSGNFTVGKLNSISGLFSSDGDGWKHSGWKNVRCFSVAVDPEDSAHILLACGNGVHESRNEGESWRILTDWRITEVLEVGFDPNNPSRFFCATAFGVWRSEDSGNSWIPWSDGLASHFVPTLSVSSVERTVWTGTDAGVFSMSLSDVDQPWRRDGLIGFEVRQVVTSENGLQAAATHGQGAWVRTVGGPWTRIRGVPADAICYAIAVDGTGRRIAVGGCFDGIYMSTDGGRSATHHVAGAPDSWTHALGFEAGGSRTRGPLMVGTTDAGLFRLSDNVWSEAGLSGTTIGRII